jgi:hypothetical protein
MNQEKGSISTKNAGKERQNQCLTLMTGIFRFRKALLVLVLGSGLLAAAPASSPAFPSSLRTTAKPETLRGVYFPSGCLQGRSFAGIVHYMKAAGLNLAVLHAKDPFGRLFWKSKSGLALEIGSPVASAPLETALRTLRQEGLWTAVKIDVFQDSLLVESHPEMGVRDSETGELWADRKGLHWANPYDRRVWDYAIALCLELVDLGVDEIQFDYIRFPSDGTLAAIQYPVRLEDSAPKDCIGKFLAYARSRLKPSGVTISVDLFGMTAWKSEDFGVGQVLEQITPHVDVVCPMFYPSHFPENFLGLKDPGRFPYDIMKSSLEEIRKRTPAEIRPWIQGFWYAPEEIEAQLRGVSENHIPSWAVWSPSGRYAETFNALANLSGTPFPEPEFYPQLEVLRKEADLALAGLTKIINATCYREGYSILSLDDSAGDRKNDFATLTDVAFTLDESIIDRILRGRGIAVTKWTNRSTKVAHITSLISQDLGIDPRRMRPSPIYVDWDNGCVFSRSVPLPRLESYSRLIRQAGLFPGQPGPSGPAPRSPRD